MASHKKYIGIEEPHPQFEKVFSHNFLLYLCVFYVLKSKLILFYLRFTQVSIYIIARSTKNIELKNIPLPIRNTQQRFASICFALHSIALFSYGILHIGLPIRFYRYICRCWNWDIFDLDFKIMYNLWDILSFFIIFYIFNFHDFP